MGMEFVPHPLTEIHNSYAELFAIESQGLSGHIGPGKEWTGCRFS